MSLTVPSPFANLSIVFLVLFPASRLSGREGGGLDTMDTMSRAACLRKSMDASSGTRVWCGKKVNVSTCSSAYVLENIWSYICNDAALGQYTITFILAVLMKIC